MTSEEILLEVSAPGKVILHGEHAVVYGKQAVAVSLGLRTTLKVFQATGSVTLDFKDISLRSEWPLAEIEDLGCQVATSSLSVGLPNNEISEKINSFISKYSEGCEMTSPQQLASFAFLYLYSTLLPRAVPLTLSVSSQMPVSAGLGSSAAYAVCLSGSLLIMGGHISMAPSDFTLTHEHLETVCQWAFVCEQMFHGMPSGIDNSICTYGGGVSFKKVLGMKQINAPIMKILLVNTCIPRNTKVLVAEVKKSFEMHPVVFQSIFDAMDAVSEEVLAVIGGGDGNRHVNGPTNSEFERLYQLIDINQNLLCGIGVSHPALDEMVQITRKHKLHSKLTGAGGGGCGFVLIGPDASESSVKSCRSELEDKGFQIFSTTIGAPGFTVHFYRS